MVRLFHDTAGATAIEYGLLIAMIAGVVIFFGAPIAAQIKATFANAATSPTVESPLYPPFKRSPGQ